MGGQLDSAVAVFAEVRLGLKRQVCRIASLPDEQIGFHGASAYDFYNSRFRGRPYKRAVSRGNDCRKVMIKQKVITEARLQNTESVVV